MAETASLLERAGLVEIAEDAEGREAYLLTADGERVDRMRAMTSVFDVDAVLDALLPEPIFSPPTVRRLPPKASTRRLM